MADAKLYAAMAKAFPEIEGAAKDTDNPAFKRDGKVHKYADLASVISAIKPALAKHELWFRQVNHTADGGVCVETFICHSSGEELSCGQLFVPASKQDAQGYGSALTYARRYSLMAAFGVAPEDDDGNAAAKSAPEPQQEPQGMPATEWAKLTSLLQATGVPAAKLLKEYGVDNLRLISMDQYLDAVQRLNEVLAKKAKAETDAKAGRQMESLKDDFSDLEAESVPF